MTVRLLVELRRTNGNGVEGMITFEETNETQRFSGWLELLRILEAAIPPREEHDE